jgi:hypothetical protein
VPESSIGGQSLDELSATMHALLDTATIASKTVEEVAADPVGVLLEVMPDYVRMDLYLAGLLPEP